MQDDPERTPEPDPRPALAAGERSFYQQLVDAAPDAVIGVDPEGVIVIVNLQAERIFGYERDELVGEPLETLLPSRFGGVHPELRESYLAEPATRVMGAGLDLSGRRSDGSEFPVDVSLTSIEANGRRVAIAAVRDITARQETERALAEAEAEVATHREQRRAAAEINDTIIQGLVLAGYALDRGDVEATRAAMNRVLGEARRIVAELQGPAEDLVPGDLRRRTPARFSDEEGWEG